ncbi:hypothetical protein BDZ88DRAFT_424977 [Geranomyces variabilis]|nr:hypothetical protein BDZ88DRAFT_424977 [Geranomyces variabilis]KAJ3141202.1 hypothetical protein HDU90_007228 [Geranomyces variabilis]
MPSNSPDSSQHQLPQQPLPPQRLVSQHASYPITQASVASPAPNLQINPPLVPLPDVASMTLEQRQRLIEQLARQQPAASSSIASSSFIAGHNPYTPTNAPMSTLSGVSRAPGTPLTTAQYSQLYPMLYNPYNMVVQPGQLQALQTAAAAAGSARGLSYSSPTPTGSNPVGMGARSIPSVMPGTPLGYYSPSSYGNFGRRQAVATPLGGSGGGPARKPRARPSKAMSQGLSPGPQTSNLVEPTPLERQNIDEIKRRTKAALEADQRAALNPDLTPFRSLEDAITRLLPYHVFHYAEDVAIDVDKEAGGRELKLGDCFIMLVFRCHVDLNVCGQSFFSMYLSSRCSLSSGTHSGIGGPVQ